MNLTSENLKSELWNTLQLVKAKGISPQVANAVAAQSREIMRVVRTEISIADSMGKKPSQTILRSENRKNITGKSKT